MSQSRTRFALALLAATCLTPVARAAPGDSLGEEFQVNTFVTNDQDYQAVAMDADGDFVVVWESRFQDGSQEGIFAQRFDAAGVAQGPEFQVNTFTTYRQTFPAVAIDADGDFVVVWTDSGHRDGHARGIFAQRFDAAGVAQGPEFQVNTYTTGSQWHPAVAMDTAGDFVVTWSSDSQDGSSTGVFAQRYDAAGVAQGPEFQVNTFTTDSQGWPAVAMDADGDFVVAWNSRNQGGNNSGIFAQRYDAAGVAQGPEFHVSATTTSTLWFPAVAMDANGDFVVAWTDQTWQDGSHSGVFAQRYDAASVAQGREFRVNTYTLGSQKWPAVAMDAEGGFIVAWESSSQDRSDWGVFAQRFNSAGEAEGTEFQVNTFTLRSQFRPAVAMDADGDFVVTWTAYDADRDVFAQRFQGEGHVAGDFDSDGRADILWRNAGTGDNVLWLMDGFARLDAGSIGAAAAPWRVAGIADFDGDYRADVLWRNEETTATLLWQMDGAEVTAAEPIGSVAAAWRVEGLGDFDGDGHADILWRNPGTRNVRIWRMNGFLREDTASIGVVPRTWEVAGVGDFDGDRKADILWRDGETGATVLWRMDDFTTLAAGTVGAPATVWQVAGTGDFDGDAKADILWRNADTGSTILWRMDGFARLAAASIGTVNSSWAIEQLRDTNGDDRLDILWRNAATGGTVLWQMDGFKKTAAQSIGAVNSSWQVE